MKTNCLKRTYYGYTMGGSVVSTVTPQEDEVLLKPFCVHTACSHQFHFLVKFNLIHSKNLKKALFQLHNFILGLD